MGVLACICAGMEVFYTRHGVRFSGLAVLSAISCFVAGELPVGTSLKAQGRESEICEELSIAVLALMLPTVPVSYTHLTLPTTILV